MKKYKISDIITIALFLGVIFGFGIAFWIMPDIDKSLTEGGRLMQGMPSFNDEERNEYVGSDYLLHGELADDFDEYYCDQFPLRKFFLSLKSATEVAFGRDVNNGVYYDGGELVVTQFDIMRGDGSIVKGSESYDEEHVRASLAALNSALEKLNVEAAVMLPPRGVDVKGDTVGYPSDVTDSLNAIINEEISDKYLVKLLEAMQVLNSQGEKPYFSTDHHWTVKGAYHAYAELMTSWGLVPYAWDEFRVETVTEEFKGTSLRNGNFFFMNGEALQIARYDGDDEFTVAALGNTFAPSKEYKGLYNFDYPAEDAYSVFLHGKPTHMRITKEGEEREKLLLFKDSFGHSLAPFLARHFDLVIVDIDVSPYGTLLDYVVTWQKPDRVLVVYNIENLIETDKLLKLK